MDFRTREEITAATAAHRELGPTYEEAVAESLVERIGAEVDKRVDAKLARYGQPLASPAPAQAPPPSPAPAQTPGSPTRSQWPPVTLALGSMLMGVFGSIAAIHIGNGNGNAAGPALAVMFVWLMIAVINVAYARHR
jgi:hypothetical protein